MPIDASIPMGVRGPEIEPYQNVLAKRLQIQEAQQSQQMNQLKMDEYQRGIEDQNALRSALSAPGADPYNVLLQRGRVKEASEYRKSQDDSKKAAADVDYKKIETAHKRVDLMGQTLGWVRQNPSAENAMQAIQYLADNGVMPPEKAQEAIAKIQANPTPQGIAQFAEMGYRAALSAKDQLPKIETRNLGGTTDTIAVDPVTQRASTVNSVRNTATPGDVLSNARGWAQINETKRHHGETERHQALTRDQSMSKPFEVTAPDGVTKILVQQDKAGNIRPVEGYLPKGGAAGDPKLTEVQSNATAFVSRMRDSSATLDDLESKVGRLDTEAAKSTYTNWLASPKAQQYQQARRNWVTANLRKESGAAIPPDELESEYKKWFPVIGDSKAVIAQKQQSRKVAEEAMLVQAGPGGRQVGGILERGGSPAVNPSGGPKKISSDAEYNALPSGTEFVGPDGKTRRKP